MLCLRAQCCKYLLALFAELTLFSCAVFITLLSCCGRCARPPRTRRPGAPSAGGSWMGWCRPQPSRRCLLAVAALRHPCPTGPRCCPAWTTSAMLQSQRSPRRVQHSRRPAWRTASSGCARGWGAATVRPDKWGLDAVLVALCAEIGSCSKQVVQGRRIASLQPRSRQLAPITGFAGSRLVRSLPLAGSLHTRRRENALLLV